MFANRYELVRMIGQGGMGVVHEAIAHGAHAFARRVVIKQLRADAAADPTLARMFLDEARTASHLHHAGIVSVFDYGLFDDRPFQVLELVQGLDVNALLRQLRARDERMPVELALFIAAEVAHALGYAHELADERGAPLGIVHRDVKPSNVLLSWAGDVKLGDFGIAKARTRLFHTIDGSTRGTPAYMAPEQFVGAAVDPRADIFALGATLHAMLSGRSPFAGEAERLAIGSQELALSPDLPADVAPIVARALRPAPSERYPTARAMAAAIGEALASRLRTDPRSRLIEWLERFRSGIAEPPPLAQRTILQMRPDVDTRTFTSELTRTAPPAVVRRRTALAPFLIATLVTVAIGVAGAAVALRGRRPHTELAAVSTPGTPIASSEADASETPAPLAEVDAAAPLDPPQSAPDPPSSTTPRRSPSPPRPSSKSIATSTPTPGREHRCECIREGTRDERLCLQPGRFCTCWTTGTTSGTILCPNPRRDGESCSALLSYKGKTGDRCEGHRQAEPATSGWLICSDCMEEMSKEGVTGDRCMGRVQTNLEWFSSGKWKCYD